MSLVAVTVDIERDTETDDGYGGVTLVSATVYSNLRAWINYIIPRSVERSESSGGASGPGVSTQTRCVVKFEPIPSSVTIAVNDRIVVESTLEEWLVTGIRTYEFTLQCDVERVA